MGLVVPVATMGAKALAMAAAVGAHVPPAHPPTIAMLPAASLASWPTARVVGRSALRCDDGAGPIAGEPAADTACVAVAVDSRSDYRLRSATWTAGSGGDDGGAWRATQAMLPGLGGLGIGGRGGMSLGLGGELRLARGERMTLHLMAVRDRRIAADTVAPTLIGQGRCRACWDDSEALGAGANGGR